MRLDRLTTKTREALMTAQQEATKRGNPELLPEHLLYALLVQPDGIAEPILQKTGFAPRQANEALKKRLDAFPKVRGGAAEPALSRRLRDILTQAWSETEKLKDEYTSAEHVLLAFFSDSELRKWFEELGLTRDALLDAIRQVR